MTTEVDLSQLALHREERSPKGLRVRRHVLTRYVLPAGLLLGFAGLAAWSAQEALFPPQSVTVVPIYATQAQVRREGTPLFKAAGWIEPRPTAIRVAALAPGVVEKLLVVEDQAVETGEPIAQLVEQDAHLMHERAVAELALRKAEVEEAQAALDAAMIRFEQPVHLQAPLAEAEAALAQIDTQLKNLPFEIRRAEAELDYARRNYEGKSASQAAITGRLVDQARSDFTSAQAQVEQLQRRTESLAIERAATVVRRDALQTALRLKADESKAKNEAAARVKIAQARVQQTQIVVAEARLCWDRMTIRAPVAGRILRLVASPGARLMEEGVGDGHADPSTVVTMYRPESLQVRADVRFEDIPKVTLNQPVRIETPAIKEPLSGKVLFISSEANIQKNTLQVKVAMESPPAVFKPEMLVDVTFLAPADPASETAPGEELRLLIPQSLIQQGEAGPFVWLADQSEGVARKTPVETGDAASDGLVEITKGLTISSRVIASGEKQLTDGGRIRITGEANAIANSPSFTMSGGKRKTLDRLPMGHHE